jgi:PAS domain S-box-containing protein
MGEGPRGDAATASRAWLIAGLVTLAGVAVADLAVQQRAVLLGVLAAGPLLASAGATWRQTLFLSVIAVAIAVPLSVHDGIWGTTDQLIRMLVLLIGCAAAVVSAALRERRDRQLDVVVPQAMNAQRLRLALDAGQMGTWQWDIASGRVEWDERLEALFGLSPGSFDGTFEAYAALVHPDDRERVVATVDNGIAHDTPWRFDHRAVWPDGSVHWLEGRGEPVRDESGAIIGASGVTINVEQRHALLEAELRARERLRVLVDASEQLGALDDPDRIVDTIADLAATRIGTSASVVRILPDARLAVSAVAHRDPARLADARADTERLTDGSPGLLHVIETGDPILRVHTNETVRTGATSWLLVPIEIAGRRLAVLSIGDDRPDPLTEADVELAVDLGRRGGSALERAQLFQAKQERFEAEHRIVELLQRTIVPEHLPAPRGVHLAATYRPAERVEVGGDWYDAFALPDGSVIVVVGDVAGHGVQAASLMGRVRNALRAYAAESSEPASILSRLHALLRMQEEGEMVTAFVARYEPERGVMSWARAGHPPPLVVAPDGATRWMDDVNGPPLGTLSTGYRATDIVLAPGSVIVCYTDGLIERRDRPLTDGLDWLVERVQEYTTDDLKTLCDKLVADPFVPSPAPDDLCVLALRTETV